MKRLLLLLPICLIFALCIASFSACGKHTHKYTEKVVAPSCLAEGYTEYVCSCGDRYQDYPTEKTGHTFANYVYNNDATCKENGTETATCVVPGCQEEYTRIKMGTALGCDNQNLSRVEPSCVEQGLTKGKTACSRCGEGAVAQQVISATGMHNYINYVCSVCYDIVVPSQGLGIQYSLESDSYQVINLGECLDKIVVIPPNYNDGVHGTKQLTNIAPCAFLGCESLESVVIPNSVTSIGNFAFRDCYRLENITIPNNVTSIGNSAFLDCGSLRSVIFEEDSKLESIGESAFSSCDSLESITIPKSVLNISSSVFRGCDILERVIFEEDSKLENIGESAFRGCHSLTSIIIPKSVTSLGAFALRDCDILESVVFEEDSKLESVGESALSGCSSLKSIILPNGVSSLGEMAFIYCDRLESITTGNKIMSLGFATFFGCKRLEIIKYNGTKIEWNAITKGSDWDYKTDEYTIYCTDGNINKS